MRGFSSIVFFLLPFLSGPLFAAEYDVGAKILGQVRKNTQNLQRLPVDGYFSAEAYGSKVSAETDMRFFRDFDTRVDKYDLYQTVLHVRPLETLQFDMGRQFVNQGFFAAVLDGVQATVSPSEHFFTTVFSGIPRDIEMENFNNNRRLLTGISLGLKNVKRTEATLHAAWRSNNIHMFDAGRNDEALVGLTLSRQFAVSSTPFVYANFEYSATGKVVQAGTAGLDIYPTSRIALNVEGNYFNVDRNFSQQTIQGLYSAGRLIDARLSSTWTLVENYLAFTENVSYENIEVLSRDFRNGWRAEAGFSVTAKKAGFRFEPVYYYIKSFGGTVNGVRGYFHEQFNDLFYAELSVDFSKYRKITNDNDNALSFYGWTGYEVAKGLVLSGGFEFNKNNFFDRDARGSFRVDYHFGKKT